MESNSTVARIDQATNGLLIAMIVIPFVLSFGSLKGLAATQHVSYAWLYPLMVDGSLLVFKFLVLRGSLHGQRDKYAWTMAVIATGISVFLNVIHVPRTATNLLLARFMAGLPPLFILAAFAAVARRIEGNAVVIDWQTVIQEAKAAAKRWQGEAETAVTQTTTLQKEVATLQAANKALQASHDQQQAEQVRLQREHERLQKALSALQAKWDGVQPALKAWEKLNQETQTLAFVLAHEVTPQQATGILGVKDVRTVQARAQKLNGGHGS